MERDDMIAALKSAGAKVDGRWSDERVQEAYDAIGPSEAPSCEMIEVRCIVPNVWTSAGKILNGETATVSADELEILGDKVEQS